MKKLKAVHIDDEQDSLDVLSMLLAEHCPYVELVGGVNSVDEGIELIEKHNPHIVFLDIEMPGKNGFALLEAIPVKTFHTIMVTGYEAYALQAIRFSALDYLLKPLDAKELKQAVEKVNPEKLLKDPRLLNLTKLLDNKTKVYDKLMISSTSGYRNVALENIVYFESNSGNYCILFLENGERIICSKSLSHYEKLLATNGFYRVHRSHMVNLRKIQMFNSKSGQIKLSINVILTVSVRKRADLKKELTKK